MAFVLETIADTIENENIEVKTIEELEEDYCRRRYEEDHALFPDAVPLIIFLGEYLLGEKIGGNMYRIRMADKGTAPEYVDGVLCELPVSLNGLSIRLYKGGGVIHGKGIVYDYALSKNLWNTLAEGFEKEHRAWLAGELDYGEHLDGAEREIPSVTSSSDKEHPKTGIMPSWALK